MKKASMILLVVFLTAATFLGGLFLGRHLNRSEVRVQQNETTTPSTSQSETAEPDPETELVDINTATVLELSTLPTIGEVIAQRIVDYRTEHGPFQSVGQLTAVDGIGEKRLESILDYITIGGQP